MIDDPSYRKLYLIQEFVDAGPVMSDADAEPMPDGLARNYFRQMLKGIEYLHSQRVIHRWVSPVVLRGALH